MSEFHLETPHLILRELNPGDIDDLAAMFANPEVMRYIGAGRVLTREEARASLDRGIAHYASDGFGLWATVEKATGRLVGRCGLIVWDDIDGRAETEVGYLLAREAWGKGYASEAALASRDFALRDLGRTRLISLIYHDNWRSIRVALGIGMSYEKDTLLYGSTVALYSLGDRPPAAP